MSYKLNQEKLEIDNTGKVASSSTADSATTAISADSISSPLLIVSASVPQTISSPAVGYKGTVDYNEGFTYNTTTGGVTILSDGVYEFSGFFYVDSGGSAVDIFSIALYLGVSVVKVAAIPVDTSLGEPATIYFSFVVPGVLVGQTYIVNVLSYNSGTMIMVNSSKSSNQLVVKKLRD